MTEGAVNALVTGGAGFIGSHLVDRLVESRKFDKVVVIDDLSGGRIENVNDKAIQLCGPRCTIIDQYNLNKIFSDYKFKYVFHLAAYAAEGLSHHIRNYNYTNNVVGSSNIINMCIKYDVKLLVFTSSAAVYGEYPTSYMPKDYDRDCVNPIDPYGIAKYAVEMDIRTARRYFGLNYMIFRPHNVYGPRQNIFDPYRNVVGIFMRQVATREPITIFGDGLQRRQFTYVDDVVEIMSLLPFNKRAYNRVFNVGVDKVTSIVDLAHAVSNSFGTSLNVKTLSYKNEAHAVIVDHSTLKDLFDKECKTDLRDGLFQMAIWVREFLKANKDVRPRRFTDIEIDKNLPESWRELT